jgi:hypothetical protein
MLIALTAGFCLAAQANTPADRPSVVVVVGAPGTPEYGDQFRRWADLWVSAAGKASADLVRVGEGQGGTGEGNDRDRLKSALVERATAADSPLWVVLIGHGTYDGKSARFSLRGRDVSDAELAEWLAPAKRPVVLIDCTSASAPFINKLSGEGRVVITATKSGNEANFTRFGQYLAEAVAGTDADLDKDGQVSLLEAFLSASRHVEEFYKSRSRLATEHALIDDNGDKLGTPAEWFRGLRATRRAKNGAALDGPRAHQVHLVPSDRERSIPVEVRRKRDQIEMAVEALREKKGSLKEDDFYRQLESLMLDLARLYRDAGVLPSSGR